MLNFKGLLVASSMLGLLAAAVPAQASTTGYVANPTTNREDWTAANTAAGATTSTNLTFDAAPVGASYTQTGFTTALTAGPGQSNNQASPVSTGEGKSPTSNQLVSGGGSPFSLTIDFAAAVAGVGLDISDYFGPVTSTNSLVLSVYSGLDGTGTLLGSYSSAHFNFQSNNVYFMGLTSTSNDILSAVFSRASDQTGDAISIDNIRSSTLVSAAPEPATWAMMILGFGLAGASLRRAQRRSDARFDAKVKRIAGGALA